MTSRWLIMHCRLFPSPSKKFDLKSVLCNPLYLELNFSIISVFTKEFIHIFFPMYAQTVMTHLKQRLTFAETCGQFPLLISLKRTPQKNNNNKLQKKHNNNKPTKAASLRYWQLKIRIGVVEICSIVFL